MVADTVTGVCCGHRSRGIWGIHPVFAISEPLSREDRDVDLCIAQHGAGAGWLGFLCLCSLFPTPLPHPGPAVLPTAPRRP